MTMAVDFSAEMKMKKITIGRTSATDNRATSESVHFHQFIKLLLFTNDQESGDRDYSRARRNRNVWVFERARAGTFKEQKKYSSLFSSSCRRPAISTKKNYF
jgi:hypothetical protein